MGQLEKLVSDALAARAGDTDATVRLARTGAPMLARSMGIPSPLVDVATALYDHLVRPELQVARGGSYTTPGAAQFARWLREQESGLFPIFGKPGAGKTALACQIADKWPATIKYMAGVPESALHGTPMRPFELLPRNIARLPEGAVVVIPDAAFEGFDSRDHGSGLETLMRQLLTVTRHRSIRIVCDSQGSSLLSKSFFNTPSCVFIRELGVTWQIAERDGFTRFARIAMAAFAEIPPEDRIGYVFAISDAAGFMGLIRAGLPPWYHDGISRAHAITDDAHMEIVDGIFRDVAPRRTPE